MNRDDLDDFFARAEDVLTDWYPSDDAMIGRVPDGDSDDLAPAGDSYYSQDSGWYVPEQWTPVAVDWIPIGQTDEMFPQAAPITGIIQSVNTMIRRMMVDASTARESLVAFQDSLAAVHAREEERRASRQWWDWSAPPTRAFERQGAAAHWVIFDESGEAPADRALRLRRHRNTGPQPKVGLDGHFRRG